MNGRPDPKRPWKAITAAVAAGLGVLLAQGQDLLPPWALLVVAVLLAGVSTFLVPNPQDRPS